MSPLHQTVKSIASRQAVSAADVAQAAGVSRNVAMVVLSNLKRQGEIVVAYRRTVTHALDGPGRRRHLVRYYRSVAR